eukprot:scaffold4.g4954.t1
MASNGSAPYHHDDGGSSASRDSSIPLKPPLPRSVSRVPDARTLEQPLLAQVKELVDEQKGKYKQQTRGYGWYEWVAWFIPMFGWVRTYKIKQWLLWDFVAGLSVAAMVVPQGMSYAKGLAGLPNVYGLYGAFVPPIFYGILGSSKQLAVGPVAVTSALLGNGLQGIFPAAQQIADPNNPGASGNASIPAGEPGSPAYYIQVQEDYNQAAIQIAFVAGFFYFAVGLFRLGFLTNFLSSAVISGFMTGASVTIALSQVKYITGQDIPRTDTAQSGLSEIFNNLSGSQFKWREFSMGTAFVYLLLSFQFLARRYPRYLGFLRAIGPLTCCIISIALMNIFDWYQPYDPPPAYVAYVKAYNKNATTTGAAPLKLPGPPIKPVGTIPKGLPGFTGSWWLPLFSTGQQMGLAALVCLIDVCESISIARTLAQKNKYRLQATQELRGLGVANIAGAMFNAYTTTGSFSRSAVNDSVGAKTGLANIVTGFTIMFVLLWLTGVFENMSANVQGAIIIVGVLQLFDIMEFLYLLKINLLDAALWFATFCFTIFLGVDVGIATGVGLSLVIAIFKTAFPKISPIGRVPGTDIYRQIALYPDAETHPHVLALRIDAPIFFGNALNIHDDIIEHSRLDGDAVSVLVLDFAAVSDVDATGTHMLHNCVRELTDLGVTLVIANPHKKVLLQLKKAGLDQKIGPTNIHINTSDAIEHSHLLVKKVAAVQSGEHEA